MAYICKNNIFKLFVQELIVTAGVSKLKERMAEKHGMNDEEFKEYLNVFFNTLHSIPDDQFDSLSTIMAGGTIWHYTMSIPLYGEGRGFSKEKSLIIASGVNTMVVENERSKGYFHIIGKDLSAITIPDIIERVSVFSVAGRSIELDLYTEKEDEMEVRKMMADSIKEHLSDQERNIRKKLRKAAEYLEITGFVEGRENV